MIQSALVFLNNFGIALVASVIFTLCIIIFKVRRERLATTKPAPDIRFAGYTYSEIYDWLHELNPAGRRLYAASQWTLDLAFPLAYGALFASLIAILVNSLDTRAHMLGVAIVLPAATVVLDLIENTLTSYMACVYPRLSAPLIAVASTTTRLKIALFIVCLLVVLALAIAAMISAIRAG